MYSINILATHHTLVEDDLVRVGGVPGPRTRGSKEAGTALCGVPAVPIIIIIIIMIIIIIIMIIMIIMISIM